MILQLKKQINFFPQKMSKVDNRLQLDVDSIQSGQGIQRPKRQLRDFFVPGGRLRAQASSLHVPLQGGGRQKYTHERRDGQHLF